MTEVRIEPLATNAEVLRRLHALQAHAADMRPAMRDIAETLLAHVEQRFDDERGPDGQPWAQLSDATQAERRRLGYASEAGVAKILERSRGLLDSIASQADAESALVTTNKRYAATHQFGDKQRKVFGGPTRADIPARPFLGFDAGDEDELLRVVRGHFEDAIR